MPIYEYLCEKCGHEFEREQRISDEPIRTCPECRARKVKRLISQTSFVLKGSGWYSDLYGSARPKKSGYSESGAGAEASGEGKSESTSDSSSEAAPASKSDPKGKPKKGKASKAAA
jgi:putative FmdB family regulatory protein